MNEMHDHEHGEVNGRAEEIKKELAKVLQQLPQEVPVYLFSRKGERDLFTKAAEQVVTMFQKLSPKIKLTPYGLEDKLAAKFEVTRAPTLVLGPDRYNVRWLGAPLGEEGRTFLEALLLMGTGRSGLSEQSLRILNRMEGPRHIKLFVSPTCPYCPQQAVNALKAAVERPDLITLEIIDIQANPDLADMYSSQSVPQTFADDILIARGAQPEELFLSSLEKMEQQTVFIPESDAEVVETDLVVVGGGPAGLTAGIYGARSGLRVVVVEKGALGGQVATTPVVENYPGFTQVGGKTLVDLMVTHALEYVQIFQGEEVMEIKPGEPIEVLTTRRRFLTRAVLLATGANYRKLGVPGETRLAGRGVSYCSTCDGPLFRGRKVVMVGGGNSAVTEALHLHQLGVKVTLVHRRDTLRAQDFLVKSIQDNQIPVVWNTEVKEIRGEDRVREVVLYNTKTKETSTLETDGVFIAVGYEPAVDLARKVGVELTPEGYIKKDLRHRTNVPGIYSGGDVEGGYKQIVTATGEGAAAAMVIFEDLIHPYWKKEKGSLPFAGEPAV
jgi:thioredoxin reductase (NADPH)